MTASRRSSIAELYRYRSLLSILVWTNMRLRYRNSYLGFLWQVLNPLILMAILAVVFGMFMRIQVDRFPVFLLAGLLPWTLFQQGTQSGLLSVVENELLLRKVYVPKLLLPVSAVLSQFVDATLSILPLLLIAWLWGSPLGPALLLVPFALALVLLATLGLSSLLAVAYVHVRDTNHAAVLALQAWFYLTPIIYPVDILPERYRWIVWLNPMSYLVECFRRPIYLGELPGLEIFAAAALFALGSALLGYLVFRRSEASLLLGLS